MNLVKLLLSILLPPVGVYMNSGVSSALFINIALTLLGWVPGIIHALWILTKTAEQDQSSGTV
jgi:uncharacterized membrane protein YqaE (UPF0057 family)